jgi:PAS domain S-box-containing protein
MVVKKTRKSPDSLLLNSPVKGPSTQGPLQTLAGIRQLFHELRVRQFELERQNEELQRVWDERQDMEVLLGHYSDLYDLAPVGYFNLDRKGTILTVNLTGAGFLGNNRDTLIHQRIDSFISEETRPDFHQFLDKVCTTRAKETCEVVLLKEGCPPIHAMIEALASESGEECRAVMVDITKRKQADESLKSSTQRLIVQEEGLRKRIASDLHDDIGQVLTALSLNLRSIGAKLPEGTGAEIQSALGDSLQSIKGILRSVRSMTAELHPSMLDEFGLADALSSFLLDYKDSTGMAVAIQIGPEFPRLSSLKEIALFRITQEALNNVVKHAAATAVTVSLKSSGGYVQLCVYDNGRGFASCEMVPLPTNPGWGLIIMRERAELVGGTFRVDSKPGDGTSIVVSIGE